MKVHPGYWGIDIGQCALKAVRLQIIDNKVTATAFDYVEHPKILSQPDADPEALTREALEKFLSRNPIKGDRVAIGVAGQSGLARFVKLPPVEEKKVEDIVKFEAKQQIPFPLEEVVWDFQKISEGATEGGFAIDTEIGLFAMKRDMISRVLNHFTGVKIEVHDIQMAPLALCNYITYDMLNKGGPDAPTDAPPPPAIGQKRKCIVVLDVGTDGSNLIITDGGKIIWQRPIPIGGNHFTRALTKELKLTFAKAEHLKRNAAKSPELANILRALKPVLTDFVGEVQRSLGYFTNTHRDAQVEYMVGLGSAFKLPGLQKYLGDKLQLRIEKPVKFNRLAGEAVTNAPVFVDNLLTFPVAYGLALQAIGAARLRTNLLPPEITWDRKIRAKKPWAAAAAACLLVGTAVWAYGESVPYAAVNDQRIDEALKKNKKANDDRDSVVKLVNAKAKDLNNRVNSVRALIAGTDERMNWLKISEFINSCVPVPGPNGNMTDENGQKRFWNTKDGQGGGSIAATDLYFKRIREGVDPKAFMADDIRQYLPADDIESVNFRYTENLDKFFVDAKRYCKDYVGVYFDGMDENERSGKDGKGGVMADPPEIVPPLDPNAKGCWVFEIRGSTWYDRGILQGPELLRSTLLANLKAKAKTTNDPTLKGRISHVFLYNCSGWKDEDPRPDTYHFIFTSLINELMPPPGPPVVGARPLPGVPTPNVTTPSGATAANWQGLTKGDSGFAADPSLSSNNKPYQRQAVAKSTTPMGSGTSTPMPMDKKGPAKKTRYEFVILFVWRENTPSDWLNTGATTAAQGPQTPAVGQPPK